MRVSGDQPPGVVRQRAAHRLPVRAPSGVVNAAVEEVQPPYFDSFMCRSTTIYKLLCLRRKLSIQRRHFKAERQSLRPPDSMSVLGSLHTPFMAALRLTGAAQTCVLTHVEEK